MQAPGQPLPGRRRGLREDGGRRGRGRLARDHVRAVHRERGQQFGQHRAQTGGLNCVQRGVPGAGQQASQPRHLGRERAARLLPLGGLGYRRELIGAAGKALVLLGQRRGAGRVHEQATGRGQAVVPGGARAGPAGGQLLVAAEDLLGDHPDTTGLRRQPLEVAAGIGQAVGMVHPQAVDEPLRYQAQQNPMGGGEHGGVLHPDRDERGDVEEPPPVQLGRGVAPIGEPVVLGAEQVRQRQPGGAGADGQHMVEVAQHRLARDGPRRALPGRQPLPGRRALPGRADGDVAETVSGRPGQDRQQQPAVLRRPVHVEPVRARRSGPVAEHRPELPVERLGHGDGHVVGHHVDDHPETVPAEPAHHGPEGRLPAQVRRHPGMVHHVVPVPGAGRRLQDR